METPAEPVVPRARCPFAPFGGEEETGAPPPPQVRGLPFLGNSLDLIRNPEGFLLDAHRKHGPAFRVRLGFEKFTVLTGHQGCEFFKEQREEGFTREKFYGRFARELGTDYFILSEPQGSEKHARLRRMMRLGFSREAAAPYVAQMINAVQAAARGWYPGRSIPVMDEMARLTFQLYGFVMADRDLSAMYPDARRYAQTIMMIGTKLAPTSLLKLPAYKRSKRAVFELMNGLFKDTRGRRPSDRPQLTILDALVQALDAPNSTHSEAEIISSSLYGFVGTMVYMSRSVSFLLYELARNPATMERATREADAAFAEGTPTAQTLRRMVYLRAAFNESLRRHPVAIGLPFCVEKDFIFEGCQIRKGETVLISHITGHFSTEHYRDPWKFEPERFLEPRNEHRSKGSLFAPFGFASRVCTAVGLVETMVLTTVATLLRTVKFELDRPSYQLQVRYFPLPGPEEGFKLRVLEHRRPPATADALPPLDEAVSDVLSNLGEAEKFAAAISRLEARDYPPGAAIIRQGEAATEFFIIIEGHARLTKRDPNGEEKEVARLGPGDSFGGTDLLTGGPSTVSASCLDAPLKAQIMPREMFVTAVTEVDLLGSDIALMAQRQFLARRLAQALPQLTGKEAQHFANEFHLERVPGGDVIIRQGDPGETFYIIVSGAVEVFWEGPEGDRLIARHGPGAYFGEMALLMRRPRTATVRAAAEGVELMVMKRDGFNRMISGSRSTKDGVADEILHRVGVLLDAVPQRN